MMGNGCSNYGARNTFTGFSPSDRADVIDVVLVLDNGVVQAPTSMHKSSGNSTPAWLVDRAGVIPNAVDDGRGGFMTSDHQVRFQRLSRMKRRRGDTLT